MAGTEDKRPREPREPPLTDAGGLKVPRLPDGVNKYPKTYTTPATTRPKAPRRKVLAGFGGAGLAGNISVILAYHLPTMPSGVVAAYTSVLVAVLAALFAYLVPAED